MDLKTTIVLAFAFITSGISVHATTTSEISSVTRDRVELTHLGSCQKLKGDMPESSVDKYVRKSSLKKHKQYQKEGWKQFSTDESLLSQIEKAFAMELELDQNGEAKYISTTIMATDKSLEVARMKAIELAKMRIASIIGEEIDASINLAIENEQKDNEGIKSSSRFVTTAKARAFHKLGHIEPVIECWRERADKSLEVHMIVMYEVNEIDRFAKDIINKNTYE